MVFDGFWLSLSLGTRFWWAFYFGFWFEKGRVLSVKRFIDLLRDLLRHYCYVFFNVLLLLIVIVWLSCMLKLNIIVLIFVNLQILLISVAE